MKLQSSYLADFISLIFPDLCQACGSSLVSNEDLICMNCIYDLPYTNFQKQPDNTVARQFWGRLNLQGAYVLLYFNKGGKVQQLMHRFKYKNVPRIGNRLGQIAGNQLAAAVSYQNVDIIIPVPLHSKKLKNRGYNQSACFAEGLADKMAATVYVGNLVRLKHTETQTKKSRFSRYENMKEVFEVLNPAALQGKHILLVDDIVTTGSTLEACGAELLKIPGLTLSVAAIAYAE